MIDIKQMLDVHNHFIGVQRRDLKRIITGHSVVHSFVKNDQRYVVVMALKDVDPYVPAMLSEARILDMRAPKELWQSLKRGSRTLIYEVDAVEDVFYVHLLDMATYREIRRRLEEKSDESVP